MPYPYDHVIRHEWEQGESPCAECYSQVINIPCGKSWCPCECMEHPSAEADLAPDNDFDERFKMGEPETPKTHGGTSPKPGPPTWKESEDYGYRIPAPPARVTASHVAVAFWTGVLTSAVIGYLATSDMNAWVRGILIAVTALGGMATAGRTMRGN